MIRKGVGNPGQEALLQFITSSFARFEHVIVSWQIA
jgi:hypothetical protein